MTIPQTWTQNFSVQVTAQETEIYRPGNVPSSIDPGIIAGILDSLIGATEINLPPIATGSTYSGVSVEFFLRPAPASTLRFPIYIWDIAANRQGTMVDLLFLMTGSGARQILLSSQASLLARIRPNSVATTTPIFLWGVALESNQFLS